MMDAVESSWNQNQAQFHALISTAAISVLPTLVLPFIPASASKPGSGALKTMLSFAVGGMMGDVFLHLLPHLGCVHSHSHHSSHFTNESSINEMIHDHDHVHDHHLVHDEFMNVVMDDHDHSHSHFYEHTNSHVHSHDDDEKLNHSHHGGCSDESAAGSNTILHEIYDKINAENIYHRARNLVTSELKVGLNILMGFLIFFLVERLIRSFSDHHHRHEVGISKKNDDHNDHVSNSDSKTGLKASGFLNLAADFMHNITDGLAIGAAFSAGHGLGVATTLSTIFHELPHEIGDYAVLVQSGISPWKAIGAQFCTAIGAIIGTLVGLSSGTEYGQFDASTLLAFTAGGFIYVSCVSVLPELLNSKSGFFQSVLEVLAFLCGVAMMILVAALE